MSWLGFALAGALAWSSAQVQSTTQARLDGLFRQFCSDTAAEHPACSPDARIEGASAYRWLLLADVCDHGDGASYCADFAALRTATRPCIVSYDQREDRWRRVESDGRADRYRWAVEDVDRQTPRVLAERTTSCLAIVTGTNPLVHVVERGSSDDVPAALSAKLDDMAALAGDAARSIVPLVVRLQAQPPLDPASGVSAMLRAVAPARPSAFEALMAGTWALSVQLGHLADLRSDVMAALNTAEAGEGSMLSPIRWDGVSLDGERWRAEFEGLRRLLAAALAESGASGDRAAASPEGGKALDMAQRVLDRQVDAARAVNLLAAVRERWRQFVIAGRVLSWSPVTVPDRTVPWWIDVRYGFVVKPLSMLGSDVVVRRQKREASFRIGAPSAAALSVVTGLVLTSSSRRLFEGRTGPDGVRRVVATADRGGPARLLVGLSWRPAQSWAGRFGAWPMRPLIQAGAIVDAKQPGAALGVGIDVRRWLQLSAGRAWQPLAVLDGQKIGDVLASGESVTTVSALVPSWYASVGVSLGALPLFRR